VGRNLKANEERFWEMIAERRRSHDQRAVFDRRIWDLYGEERTIMFTDLSGFSRRVAAFGIIEFLELILEQRELFVPIIAEHDGVLIKEEADSMMIVFRRPAAGLDCARAMQAACDAVNVGRPPENEILLCLGLGHGPILRIGDVDVYGEQVNWASKLGEDVARAHETLVTAAFREALGETTARFEPLEDERVANAWRCVEYSK
jgi:class 3 adenylate cyclase